MELLGYYTAGFLLCLIGETHEYKNCIAYRSPNSYSTEENCMKALFAQRQMLWYSVDPELYEIIDIKCIEWLEPGKAT